MNTVVFATVIGVGIGLVVGALGAGGGILSVPVLVFVLGMAPHDATGASLVVVGLTAIVALRHPAQQGNVRWREGLTFGAIAIVGAALASRLSLFVPDRALMLSFGALLLIVAIVMARRAYTTRLEENAKERGPTLAGQPSEPEPQPSSRLALVCAASATGLLTGFFGVGGGFLAVPMLVIALGMPMRAASGTSLLVMIMTSAAALLARIGTPTHIDWPSVLIFAAGTVLGGMAGGPLSAKARPSSLTALFAVLLAGVGVLTLATA
ncbi:permease [Dermabacter sp. HMSC06F07]|uniref:Probable membrane transporter protein n=1 Tax=Dermabacter hominis 1368 TaxID=1450519 RepID=A0ABR4SJ89_9MICO|nr:sulfite exporter TauE/SafE family protein [Dermabacter sp. HMSC06F07]KDS93259.1 permease [Dermabacter hominis 1368]OFT46821.1 permease [Dermabacter sp. HMSC06F07]